MGLLLIDGFDLYNGTGTLTGLQAAWSAISLTNGSMQTGRLGGQSLQYTGSFGSDLRVGRSFAAQSTVSMGLSLFCSSVCANSASVSLIGLYSGATSQVGLCVNGSNQLQLCRMTGWLSTPAVLGTTGSLLANTWYDIGVEITISDTVGVFNIYINGALDTALSNVDTRNGTPTTVDTVYLGCGLKSGTTGGSGTWRYDDLFITTNAYPGPRRVETLRATADTSQKDFTPDAGTVNYSRINETLCDGDTSYVSASVVGNTDRYAFGSLSATPSVIDAVQLTTFAEKTDVTTRAIALQVKSGATVNDGSNLTLGSSYAKYDRITETDPNTSAAWGATAVNSINAGPKVTV